MSSVSNEANTKVCAHCGNDYPRPLAISAKQWVKRRFCSNRCAGMRGSFNVDDIVGMYIRGMSSNEIARSVGVSGVHVIRILKSRGIERRGASENKALAASREEVRAKMSAASSGRRLPESAKNKLRQRVGRKNANWRGGITTSSHGYLQYTNSQVNGSKAGMLVHHVVGEEKYGRPAVLGWHFHHVDCDKRNNAPSNILLMTDRAHGQLHAHLRRQENHGK